MYNLKRKVAFLVATCSIQSISILILSLKRINMNIVPVLGWDWVGLCGLKGEAGIRTVMTEEGVSVGRLVLVVSLLRSVFVYPSFL